MSKHTEGELLEAAKEMLEVIGNRRVEGGISSEQFLKWQRIIMESEGDSNDRS